MGLHGHGWQQVSLQAFCSGRVEHGLQDGWNLYEVINVLKSHVKAKKTMAMPGLQTYQ